MLNYSTIQSLPLPKSNKQQFLDIKRRLIMTTDRCDINTRSDINYVSERFKAINALPFSTDRENIEQAYFKLLEEYNDYVLSRKNLGALAKRITRVRLTDTVSKLNHIDTLPICNKAELSVLRLTREFLLTKTKFNKHPFELYCLVDSLLNTILQQKTTPPNAAMHHNYHRLLEVVSLGVRLGNLGIY